MSGLKRAKERDDTLKLFSGNKSWTWEQIQQNHKENYHTTENHIKFLLGEGCLEEKEESNSVFISLTNKGFSKLANLSSEGYYAIRKARVISRFWRFSLGLCTILILSLSIYNTFFSNRPNTKSEKTTKRKESLNKELENPKTLQDHPSSEPNGLRQENKKIEQYLLDSSLAK